MAVPSGAWRFLEGTPLEALDRWADLGTATCRLLQLRTPMGISGYRLASQDTARNLRTPLPAALYTYIFINSPPRPR